MLEFLEKLNDGEKATLMGALLVFFVLGGFIGHGITHGQTTKSSINLATQLKMKAIKQQIISKEEAYDKIIVKIQDAAERGKTVIRFSNVLIFPIERLEKQGFKVKSEA